MRILAMLGVALTASAAAPVVELAVGDQLPPLKGEFLSGRTAVLPQAASGRVALLMLGFTYDSRFQVEAWAKRFRQDFGTKSGVTFFEIPMIGGMARMGKWFIDSGMRRGTHAQNGSRECYHRLRRHGCVEAAGGLKRPDGGISHIDRSARPRRMAQCGKSRRAALQCALIGGVETSFCELSHGPLHTPSGIVGAISLVHGLRFLLPCGESGTNHSAMDALPDSHSAAHRDEAGSHRRIFAARPGDSASLVDGNRTLESTFRIYRCSGQGTVQALAPHASVFGTERRHLDRGYHRVCSSLRIAWPAGPSPSGGAGPRADIRLSCAAGSGTPPSTTRESVIPDATMVPSSLVIRPSRIDCLVARGAPRPKGFGRNNQGLPPSPTTRSISTIPQSQQRHRKLSVECSRRSERTPLPFRRLENRHATRKDHNPGHQGTACIRTHASQTETLSA